jgi:hypothetical protein
MQRRVFIVSVLLGVAVVAVATVQTRPAHTYKPAGKPTTSSRAEVSPMAALNRCIQTRFHTLTSFGMGRIPVVPQHVQRFKPETEAEKAAVADLQKAGWEVALYLGGRGLLKPKMSKAEWEQAGRYSFRRAISHPIFLAEQSPKAKVPEPWELWEHGQKALITSTTGDTYTASFGQWLIDARPVRANQVACLRCHATEGATGYPPLNSKLKSTLHVGDAMGVVIYIYRHKEPVKAS